MPVVVVVVEEEQSTNHMFPHETSFRNSGFKDRRCIYSTTLRELAQRQKRNEKLEAERGLRTCRRASVQRRQRSNE
ncbi:hypothetical protein C8R44DRAFT_74958 [Mycena epipterygia]|nr:hypothetical protein C8R44DRAFT_74958 [Mycena epipterygia]